MTEDESTVVTDAPGGEGRGSGALSPVTRNPAATSPAVVPKSRVRASRSYPDEIELIRLIDLEGLEQEEAA